MDLFLAFCKRVEVLKSRTKVEVLKSRTKKGKRFDDLISDIERATCDLRRCARKLARGDDEEDE